MENRYYSDDHTSMINPKKIRVIKAHARENLLGKYGAIIAGTLLIQVISVLLSSGFSSLLGSTSFFQHAVYYVANFIITMLVNLFYAGIYKMHLDAGRGQECSLNALLFPTKNGTNRFLVVAAVLTLISYFQAIPTSILSNYVNLDAVFNGTLNYNQIIIWTVVALVGTIINIVLALNFALAFFLLMDNPNMSGLEALRNSIHYMKGNKLRLFFLNISFIGMCILGILTAGIAYLWILPYMDQSVTVLYETVVQPEHTTSFNEKHDTFY